MMHSFNIVKLFGDIRREVLLLSGIKSNINNSSEGLALFKEVQPPLPTPLMLVQSLSRETLEACVLFACC